MVPLITFTSPAHYGHTTYSSLIHEEIRLNCHNTVHVLGACLAWWTEDNPMGESVSRPDAQTTFTVEPHPLNAILKVVRENLTPSKTHEILNC